MRRSATTMTKFLVQVVLHETRDSAIHERLNAAMQDKGFVCELPGKKAAYHLPKGTYWYEGEMSINEIRFMASRAAQTTEEEFGIVVVRSNGWSVMGLKRAEAAPRG